MFAPPSQGKFNLHHPVLSQLLVFAMTRAFAFGHRGVTAANVNEFLTSLDPGDSGVNHTWCSKLRQVACAKCNVRTLEKSAQVGVLASLRFGVVVENFEQKG